jgi:ribosomal protein L37AE/L43A
MRSQQWEILETHPFFTGICPNCETAYLQNVKIIHYDCQSCGWMIAWGSHVLNLKLKANTKDDSPNNKDINRPN